MKTHAVVHYKCQSHSIILYRTFISFDLFSQTGLLDISVLFMVHIWTIDVPYLDDECYLFVRVFHIWTMSAIYLYECSISGRWVLSICTGVPYLDDECYISWRVLHIWTMEVTVHIWTGVTYLDGYKSARHILCTANVRFRTPPRHPLSRPWRRVMVMFWEWSG